MQFIRRKLKNGMTVIFEKRELPVIALSITNRFGAAFETSDIKGVAHVMEHLVFTGTKTRSHEDISREIEKKGGILNAFTSHDVTSFWFKLPAEHVFAGLDILTDLLVNPTFNPDKFEKEKRVILEEIKMYHDAPQRHVFDKIESNLYEAPFGESIIGSVDTVSALKRDFVVDYFKTNYNPENYIVTLVGNVDIDKICTYLELNFKPSPNKQKIQKIIKKNASSVEEREGIDQAHYVFAIHAPMPTEKEYYALEVLDAYLADGMSSRLFLKIREEKGLAYAIKSSMNTEKNYSFYSIYVGTTKAAIPEVQKIILEEFKLAQKITDQDIKEAKERLIGLRKIATEESAGVMNELMFTELTSQAEEYYKHVEKIQAVTPDDVRKMAIINKFSTAAIVPK